METLISLVCLFVRTSLCSSQEQSSGSLFTLFWISSYTRYICQIADGQKKFVCFVGLSSTEFLPTPLSRDDAKCAMKCHEVAMIIGSLCVETTVLMYPTRIDLKWATDALTCRCVRVDLCLCMVWWFWKSCDYFGGNFCTFCS